MSALDQHRVDVPTQHADARGRLAELIRRDRIATEVRQIYVSTTRPGHVRGDHYHTRKTEWFCVVKGRGLLELRDMKTRETLSVVLDEKEWPVVTIPPHVHHKITNVGEEDMILLSAVDLEYVPADPDTFRDEQA